MSGVPRKKAMYASANLLSNLPIIPLLLNLKIEIKIPRRGAVLIHDLIELDDSDDQNKVIAVEKIIWSLSQIGVATLLRDVRYMHNDLIKQATEKIL